MDSLGELVKAWRQGSGLTQKELAAKIGGTVKYQNIQQLESGDAKLPRYIAALAMAMRTTVEDLVALKMPPLLGEDVRIPLNHDLGRQQDVEVVPEATVSAAIRFLAATVAEKDAATRELAAEAVAGLIRPDRVAQFRKALEEILRENDAKMDLPVKRERKAAATKPPRKQTGTGG